MTKKLEDIKKMATNDLSDIHYLLSLIEKLEKVVKVQRTILYDIALVVKHTNLEADKLLADLEEDV